MEFTRLDATDEQLSSPILYCSGRDATATLDPDKKGIDLKPLFDTILRHMPAPEGEADASLQIMVSAIDYNDYVGRIGIGRIERGTVKSNQEVTICDFNSGISPYKGKIANLYQIDGLKRTPIQDAKVGDIVCFSGIPNVTIGNTICSNDKIEPVKFVNIGEPTIEMYFSVNDGPFAGKEGKFLTSRHIKDRLEKELLKDVSLRVYATESADTFKVCGRGEMHLSILIETMRREGYEFCVSPPKVIFKEVDGKKLEPIERLYLDVPTEDVGSVMERMGNRKGELITMTPSGSRIKMEFKVPSRGLFGFKNELLTDTKGEGIMNQLFDGYAPYKGEIARRNTGSLIAFETGEANTYGLFNAQERGILFITPQTKVYEGMVVGMCPKAEDLRVNVCKKKAVTNMRAAGSDEALKLVTPRVFSLEESIEFINADERLEITPQNIRIRKAILSAAERMRQNAKSKNN